MRKIVMLLIAVVMAYGGAMLARYAEADDAPGGVVMGGLIILSAIVIALKAFFASPSGQARS